MRRYGLWLAAAIVVLANLGAWAAAARNRGGEPDAVLVLTERELRLPAKQADNTALTLTLVYEFPRERGALKVREAGWFDCAKLASIGFDCSRPVTRENASYYRSRPPRTTYAALEFEGEGWQTRLQEEARVNSGSSADVQPLAADRQPNPTISEKAMLDLRSGSHLATVDVDNDPSALRRRHPDRRRTAIVEATAALMSVENPGQAPYLAGRVTSVLPGEINVPREWRALLEGLQSEQRVVDSPPQREPRFRATVAWGSRLEPWITNVELSK